MVHTDRDKLSSCPCACLVCCVWCYLRACVCPYTRWHHRRPFSFSISLNRTSRDSLFHLLNFTEPRCQTVATVERSHQSEIKHHFAPPPHRHPPKTTCLCLRLHYPPLQHRPGAHCKIWHPHKGDIPLQRKWIRLSKAITY